MANLPANGFLPATEFAPCTDLDGKNAAAHLESMGAIDVTFRDLKTNGLATGWIDGVFVQLSTNGYFSKGGA
jgi:hypothetical protein